MDKVGICKTAIHYFLLEKGFYCTGFGPQLSVYYKDDVGSLEMYINGASMDCELITGFLRKIGIPFPQFESYCLSHNLDIYC